MTLNRHNIAVVIPALNERLRICDVVDDALQFADTVIVVDDGSDDGTSELIQDRPITLLRHSQRMGKGQSLRDGFKQALAMGALAVTTMDGDGQHLAKDIPRLIEAANAHPGDVIIGARMKKRASQPWYRRLGNDFGDWGISWGCGYGVVDTQSGQRLYPRSVFSLDNVPGEGFVYEAQLLISASRRAGAGVVCVPIEARYACTDAAQEYRKSHFRLGRDLYNITSHVVGQVIAYGHVVREYRNVRRQPARVFES
ncbi:glycosyltransferase family 2 protein [Lysobacter sp. HDW10]|jgi:glycosyltransferase involved in cell wall biosynthesis|uniref:glycosyltransferase family 2 protein n=1 Tax=Lysobacter sp. HDW10 TaxID=2714936 RepID=UPI00140932AF|nr:glycosyltransferase family 2 protein [Lysobacter sp. HDW10]